jgi:hypothetical protein
MVNQILGYARGDDLADTSDSRTDPRSVRFGGLLTGHLFAGGGHVRGGAAASWDKFENLSGLHASGGIAPCTPHGGVSLVPSPLPSPASTRVQFTGCRFAGEGVRARRGCGLAADLIHQPPQGGWGLFGRAESN